MLERKVFVKTSSSLYPNLYTILVGGAGLGKTRAIMKAMEYVREVPDMHLSVTSATMAFMTDQMSEAKRTLICLPDPPIEYNSLFLCADELSAFMSQFDSDLVAGLTTFYDCVPYSQGRRTKDLRIYIEKPQLNILCGSTPSNLVKLMPEFAWEQGLTSRMLLIYGNEQPIIDVFNTPYREPDKDLIHDLKIINGLVGQFGWTEEYATAMHNWKVLGFPPVPRHPKLTHYNSRRFAHMIKLSMIASVCRSNELMLTKADFNHAMGWILEAEQLMPAIFQAGTGSQDSAALDEIVHYVATAGARGRTEHQITRFAKDRGVPIHSIMRTIEVLAGSGMIQQANELDRQGLRVFTAPDLSMLQ